MDLAWSMSWMLSETRADRVLLTMLEAVRLRAVRRATRPARAISVRIREESGWLKESTISFMR